MAMKQYRGTSIEYGIRMEMHSWTAMAGRGAFAPYSCRCMTKWGARWMAWRMARRILKMERDQ